MRLLPAFLAVCAHAVLAATESGFTDSTTVYIQAVSSTKTPVNTLAEIQYNPSTLSGALTSFENPDLSSELELVRIGIYDSSMSTWKTSTSVASVENFAKGYSPTFVLTLDAQGGVLGVSVKSSKIDAGQTRDFGPKVKIVKTTKGKLPDLNRPVVLSPEGKLEEPEAEKTFLQKYWWILLGGMMLLVTAGGNEK